MYSWLECGILLIVLAIWHDQRGGIQRQGALDHPARADRRDVV